jgi:hypothetical protein
LFCSISHLSPPDLSALETELAVALEEKAHQTLATYVRHGKKYQRLPFVIGGEVRDLEGLFMGLYRATYPLQEVSWAEWLEQATVKYAKDVEALRVKIGEA